MITWKYTRIFETWGSLLKLGVKHSLIYLWLFSESPWNSTYVVKKTIESLKDLLLKKYLGFLLLKSFDSYLRQCDVFRVLMISKRDRWRKSASFGLIGTKYLRFIIKMFERKSEWPLIISFIEINRKYIKKWKIYGNYIVVDKNSKHGSIDNGAIDIISIIKETYNLYIYFQYLSKQY